VSGTDHHSSDCNAKLLPLSALFWYRDCVSRTVLDHCVDGSRTVVDLLMQDHQRSLATCRDYNREQCSGVSAFKGSMVVVLMVALLVRIFH